MVIGGVLLLALLGAGLAVMTMLLRRQAQIIVNLRASMMEIVSARDDVPHLDRIGIPGQERQDEIGDISRTVQIFKGNAIESSQLRQNQENERRRNAEALAQSMNDLSDMFEQTVSTNVAAVEAASKQINITAGKMAERSRVSGGRSIEVGEAAVITTNRAGAASEGTRQLAQSVNEIARQITNSGEVSRQAVGEVNAMMERMSGLSGSVKLIGEVVSLINDIASQTNLLALNATIEAARAGDAGKGFAVVAGEVKNLANQTARATDEIARQINDVQSSTEEMAASIGSVVETIRELDKASSAIASAVQEQEAATRDIASNIDDVATQAKTVSRSVVGLAKASAMTSGDTVRVIWSIEGLQASTEELRSEALKFLMTVRNYGNPG